MVKRNVAYGENIQCMSLYSSFEKLNNVFLFINSSIFINKDEAIKYIYNNLNSCVELFEKWIIDKSDTEVAIVVDLNSLHKTMLYLKNKCENIYWIEQYNDIDDLYGVAIMLEEIFKPLGFIVNSHCINSKITFV